MKTVLAVLLALLSIAANAEPRLAGLWQSDRESTMRFIRERSKLEERTSLFFEQMTGRLTLEFSKGRLTSSMPSWESVNAEGAKSQLVGFSETHPFKVVASTESQVAVVSQEPITGRRRVTVYNFDGPNRMWVYLGEAPFPDMNFREYFVRVK